MEDLDSLEKKKFMIVLGGNLQKKNFIRIEMNTIAFLYSTYNIRITQMR